MSFHVFFRKKNGDKCFLCFAWVKKSEISQCKRNTQSLSDNLYRILSEALCAMFPSGPAFILATVFHSAFCLWQHPSLVCAELVCCVSSPHLGDISPRPIPHFEHRDNFHPRELSLRWQASQHKEHTDLHMGTVLPGIRFL